MMTIRNNRGGAERVEDSSPISYETCSQDACNQNDTHVELFLRVNPVRTNTDWWIRRRKLKAQSDYINKKEHPDRKFLRQSSSANSSLLLIEHSHQCNHHSSLNLNKRCLSTCSSSSRVCAEEEKTRHRVLHSNHHEFDYVETKAKSKKTGHSSYDNLTLMKMLREKTYRFVSSSYSTSFVVTLLNFLVIFAILHAPKVEGFPTNDCDWIGR
jgi:hypothetical protein